MTDIHSHLIYGIDDGARSLEESIELIKKLSSIGFDNLIITPHYIEDSEYSASNEIKEEKLEIIKENMKSNETEDYNEQEYDQSLIMYPERDSVERIDNYMTSGPKIKKMHLKHKYRGTTK